MASILTQIPVPISGGSGLLSVPITPNPAAAGLALFAQAALLDPGAPQGVAFSDALALTLCP